MSSYHNYCGFSVGIASEENERRIVLNTTHNTMFLPPTSARRLMEDLAIQLARLGLDAECDEEEEVEE
jgi:hypothetical protein